MEYKIDRRSLLKTGAALAATQAVPAWAQDKPLIRMAAVFSDKDIRAEMFNMIIKDNSADFRFEPYYMGSLFKQGTELVALQRDNLEIGNIAPQDISKQMAPWSVLTSAYTFRDANHVLAFFGLHPKLGPIAEWGLELEGKRQIHIDPRTCETSLPGVYAAGDVAGYEGKITLITIGMGEAAIAANNAIARIRGEKVQPKYSTD